MTAQRESPWVLPSPLRRRWLAFPNLKLEVQPAWTMTLGGARKYRAVTIRVHNRGLGAAVDAVPYVQSFVMQGRDILDRDEPLTWTEDDPRLTGVATPVVPKTIQPGSGEAVISVAHISYMDETESVEIAVARRDDNGGSHGSMLLFFTPEWSPVVMKIRIIADGYASRPCKIRLWVTHRENDETWETLGVERVSRLRNGGRWVKGRMSAIGAWADRYLRIPVRHS